MWVRWENVLQEKQCSSFRSPSLPASSPDQHQGGAALEGVLDPHELGDTRLQQRKHELQLLTHELQLHAVSTNAGTPHGSLSAEPQRAMPLQETGAGLALRRAPTAEGCFKNRSTRTTPGVAALYPRTKGSATKKRRAPHLPRRVIAGDQKVLLGNTCGLESGRT